MKAAKKIEYVPDPNRFDLVTHRWDSQGQLIHKDLYRSFIRDGAQYFERPLNSGNLWHENNQPAGRVECKFNEKGHIVSKEFNHDAPHKQFTAPLKGAEKVHYELELERMRSAELEAELAAIRGEREVKTPVPEAAKGGAPTLSKRS